MPSTSPAAPTLHDQLGEACPVRSRVKGCRSGRAPGTDRRADRAELKAAGGEALIVSPTPTTPWPPSAVHSSTIRPIAVRRASYIVLTSGANDRRRTARRRSTPASWLVP